MAQGIVEINGKKFIERAVILNATVTIPSAAVVPFSLVLPGEANFMLKAITRQTVAAGASVSRLFLYRLGNSDGNVWYHMGGIGATNDRCLDVLTFGTGQFPYVFTPPHFYSKNASIRNEFESVSATFPYTIYLGFHGSYLIPA